MNLWWVAVPDSPFKLRVTTATLLRPTAPQTVTWWERGEGEEWRHRAETVDLGWWGCLKRGFDKLTKRP